MDKNNPNKENRFLRVAMPDSIGINECNDMEKNIWSRSTTPGLKLLVDFTGIDAINSAGINLLIKLRKRFIDQGGGIFLVNVSDKLREMLVQLNLDRVFPIYGTDKDFDANSVEDLNKKQPSANANKFIFVARVEGLLYRLSFSGFMSSLDDLSAIRDFYPEAGIDKFVMNVENLEVVDTFGAQLFNEFVERLKLKDVFIVFYGANTILVKVLNLFPTIRSCTFYRTESEALAAVNAR